MADIVIIGLGNIARTRHIPSALASKGLNVVGFVDRNAERLANVSKEFGVKNCWSPDELRSIENIDGAIVCTPPMDHAATIEACIDNGWHVLTEKPFTMTVEEADALLKKAEHKGLVLSVVSNFVFSRSFKQFEKADIGRIRNVYGFQCSNLKRRLPVWYEELPFGLFYDESPHFLYLFHALAGDLEYVSSTAFLAGRNTPLQVSASLKGSVPISLFMNFDSPISEWYLVVFGTKAVAIIDIFRDICTILQDDESHLAHNILRTSVSASLQHFLGSARTAGNVLTGGQRFGNDIVLEKWLDSMRSGVPDESLSARRALESVRLSHKIIDNATRFSID